MIDSKSWFIVQLDNLLASDKPQESKAQEMVEGMMVEIIVTHRDVEAGEPERRFPNRGLNRRNGHCSVRNSLFCHL